MVDFSLLGKKVSFHDPELRLFDLQHFLWEAQKEATSAFDSWYMNEADISSVLYAYESFAERTVSRLMVQPLFEQLRDYEIYDVSARQYAEECLNLYACSQAFQTIEASYEKILNDQDREAYRRNVRRANRSRWSSGGFGLAGAIQGAVEATALNTASYIGHSMFNAVGNAGSAVAAGISKSQLYSAKATKDCLLNGIYESLLFSVNAHINLLNDHLDGVIKNVFNEEKSNALFENAKIVKEKSVSLLVDAVTLCPWNYGLLQYLFITYPTERKVVWSIADRFCVDLSANVENIIAQEYTEKAKTSEKEAQVAKAAIFAIMKEYGILESATLNELEQDCVARLCYGLGDADEDKCNRMRERIKQYQALESNKRPFFDKIQRRIEEIWAGEDKDTFDNIYLQTDITSPQAVAAAIEAIQQKSRSSIADAYIEALNSCDEKTIQNARQYHEKSEMQKLSVAAVIAAILTALTFYWWGNLLSVILGVVAAILFIRVGSMKSAWKKLTLDNTVTHPALTIPPAASAPKEKQWASSKAKK